MQIFQGEISKVPPLFSRHFLCHFNSNICRYTRGLPMWFCLKSGFRAKIGISRKNRDFRRPWAKYWDFKCTRWAAPSVCTLKSLFFAMGALWALEIHGFCKEVHMRAPMAKFWDFKVHTEGTHEGRLSDWFECMLLWYDSSNTLNHWSP